MIWERRVLKCVSYLMVDWKTGVCHDIRMDRLENNKLADFYWSLLTTCVKHLFSMCQSSFSAQLGASPVSNPSECGPSFGSCSKAPYSIAWCSTKWRGHVHPDPSVTPCHAPIKWTSNFIPKCPKPPWDGSASCRSLFHEFIERMLLNPRDDQEVTFCRISWGRMDFQKDFVLS